jgi:hypothetical protein
MVKLEWNALRVGDKVLVHHPTDVEMPLLPGTVAIVETAHGANSIGVRVGPDSDHTSVLRPARLAVHADPAESTEECWRCDAIIASGDHRRQTASASTP